MRVVYIIPLLVVLFLGVVYGALSATGNDRADMTGKIVGICHENSSAGNNGFNSILVEGTIFGNSQNQNVSVKITENTTVLFKHESELKNASKTDLKSGQMVEIKFAGKLLQTYPPQANALQIIILR